ncbi:hypothetical protein LS68_005060 [Helicobacter sp. MIT 05-5293]|uniref:RipA family octameric membrane protein n=1 Tax=Helicobacter sp. MIT 05-5293 TaxID=1548149 RepID=UPI00051D429B|nr:hypothetical protein [Helicobacter sp. MIT 05-5293]TLD80849.1 hypothetical protein LS68_005060 [Helicobacter sp. MIT 05-5293]
MDAKEDLTKYIWEAHNFEIKNLWQRSILLVPLIVMAFTAMGILQLKIIDDITKSKDEYIPLLCAELFVCNVGAILSLFWVALAKASKFIQEAHEEHLKDYLGNEKAYCNLDDYNKDFCFFSLKPYRFSPSKINIALGWFSASIFVYVFIINLLLYFCEINICCLIGLGIITLIINILLLFFCKGGKMQSN